VKAAIDILEAEVFQRLHDFKGRIKAAERRFALLAT
jgi:hypothetical protein